MKEVKALAVMTRPELEQALADVNVTRHDMHKLLELQHEQVRVLRAALEAVNRYRNIDNAIADLFHIVVSAANENQVCVGDLIDAALAATGPRP